MQRTHADRLEVLLGQSVSGALAPRVDQSAAKAVPQPCHTGVLARKKPLQNKGFMVALTGFESAAPVLGQLRGPSLSHIGSTHYRRGESLRLADPRRPCGPFVGRSGYDASARLSTSPCRR
jgi:hypothetical protein